MGDQALLEEVQRVVEATPDDVVAVYLYGSQGRGDASPESDIDLGILLRDQPPPALRNTARRIESDVEAAAHRPVEAVVLNGASADLIHRVLRDGVLLLDRDPVARIRFEVRARNEYFDLAPIRRLYRSA